jgi:Na+-driven multidrug efflux pump
MHAGVAIGGGWQALVAYINIGCYYVFGLPLGYLLGYRANLGVEVRLLYVHAAHFFFKKNYI